MSGSFQDTPKKWFSIDPELHKSAKFEKLKKSESYEGSGKQCAFDFQSVFILSPLSLYCLVEHNSPMEKFYRVIRLQNRASWWSQKIEPFWRFQTSKLSFLEIPAFVWAPVSKRWNLEWLWCGLHIPYPESVGFSYWKFWTKVKKLIGKWWK